MILETLTTDDRQRTIDAAHRQQRRVEALLARASFLPKREYELLDQVFNRGVPVSTLARIAGRRPRAMQTRVQRLLRHLNNPLVVFAIEQLSRFRGVRRDIALEHIIRRRTQREVASDLGVSMYRVRREVEAIRTRFELQQERTHP